LHLAQAIASEAKLVLGKVRIFGRSNKTAALSVLLDLLDINDRTMIVDAMPAQRRTAETTVERNSHCILALKGNQGTLNGDVRLYMKDPDFAHAIDMSSDVVEKVHSRIEIRRTSVCSCIDRLQEQHDWPSLMATGFTQILPGHVQARWPGIGTVPAA